jgi:hypothetical protein
MKTPRKIIVHIAASADGYIARPDGDVAWLDRPRPKGNYGYSAFFKSIDTILWGYKTYAKGLEMGMEKRMKAAGFGPKIRNYVFSRHPREAPLPTFEFVNGPHQVFRPAPARPARQTYLDDGRRRNHRLLFGPRRNRRVRHPLKLISKSPKTNKNQYNVTKARGEDSTLCVAASTYPVSLRVKLLRGGHWIRRTDAMLRSDPASSHGGHTMKLLAAIGVLLFVSVPAHAQAAKPCEELKDEITKKLDAKGVKGYTLEIVAKDKDAEGKIVGTCDGGTKKILYNRTPAPAETPTKETPKP